MVRQSIGESLKVDDPRSWCCWKTRGSGHRYLHQRYPPSMLWPPWRGWGLDWWRWPRRWMPCKGKIYPRKVQPLSIYWHTRQILALKILANRLRSNVDPEIAEDLAKPVLRLLGTLVQSGELRHEADTPYFYSFQLSLINECRASTRARLRLEAGLIVLKLCGTRLPDGTAIYESMFTPKSFNLVALLPQVQPPEK